MRTRSMNFPNTLTPLDTLFDNIQRAITNFAITSGALAIVGAGSAIVKTVNAVYFCIDEKIYSKAAGNMAALAGTVTNAKFNVFVHTVNAAGTLATRMGVEAATLGGVTFPTIPDGEVVIGFTVINPTGTGNFVGGTTVLDDITVVPNAAYINTPFPFAPGAEAI